ncbi:4'-phosphopantetheinyl transferase superfamily protein [Streptomyces sp. NPDC052109]|uniref:4'-phosphopantetheinyl transferase family protein n=1 Tax=Streptomyces sp. NPDC052109 TaxID=3155527 RepID=UPI003432ADAD
MTHCASYHAAAVASGSSTAALGVDGEPSEPVPEGVRELITLPEERPVLDRLGTAHPGGHWDRLLFSAKESVYKAWFPLTGRRLDLDQCAITPDPEPGTPRSCGCPARRWAGCAWTAPTDGGGSGTGWW